MISASHDLEAQSGAPRASGHATPSRSAWRLLRDERAPDTRLHVAIAAPRGHAVAAASARRHAPHLPSLFAAAGPAGTLELVYEFVDRDLDPLDWLSLAVEHAGLIPLDDETTETPMGRVGTARFLSTRSSEVVHAHVLKDGELLLAAIADGDAESARRSVRTLHQLHPTHQVCAEETAVVTLAHGPDDPVAVGFVCPASWTPAGPPRAEAAPDRARVRLVHHAEQQPLGRLDAVLHPRGTDAADAVESHLRGLAAEGVRTAGTPIVPIETTSRALTEAVLADATGLAGGVDVCLRTWGLSTAAGVITLGLCSPARGASPEVWAMNTRALTIARSTIHEVPMLANGEMR